MEELKQEIEQMIKTETLCFKGDEYEFCEHKGYLRGLKWVLDKIIEKDEKDKILTNTSD